MAQAPSGGMEPAEMKKLLIKSKEEPVNCAVGLSGKGAVIMLHKIKPGRAIMKDLEKEFPDLKAPKFGTASVNVDEDAKLVLLTLNKGGGGLANKLKKSLKGTGFSKVRIQTEDGEVEDSAAEEGDEEAPAAAAPAAAPAAEGAPAAPAAPPPAAEAPAAAPAAAAAEPDTAPAAAAQGDSTDEKAAPAAPNVAVLAKSRMAWTAARKKVETELDKLHAEMTKHYDGHAFGADLDKVFKSKVEPMMSSLDTSLTSKLDEVTSNKDPAQHKKLVGEARQILSKYESFIQSEPLIAQLDSNPFVPLAIQKTLTATLAALSKAVN